MGALERARADLEAGRLWKARDRLEGHLGTAPVSQETLALLGEVCARMADLPAAGRYWYLTEEGGGADAEAARRAFEERCGGNAVQMLQELPLRPPRSVSAGRARAGEGARLLGPGRRRPPAAEGGPARRRAARACAGRRERPAGTDLVLLTVGVWFLGVAFLVLLLVRLVT